MNQRDAEHAPQGVAEGDAARLPASAAANASGSERLPLEDQVAGKGKQRFIGHGQADDAEHQQQKDGEVAVLRDPGENLCSMAAGYPRRRGGGEPLIRKGSKLLSATASPPTTTMPLSVTW